MKRTATILIFFCMQLLSADHSLIDRYSFTQLTRASAPKAVTVINHEKKEPGEASIINGLLFSYKSRKAPDVKIAGDFNKWQPEPMTKGENGVWFYFLSEYEGRNEIRYKFLVNGIWIYDPENSMVSDDGIGSFLSLTEGVTPEEGKHITYREISENGVNYIEFRTWQPEAGFVSVAGDFNNWNPENDPLMRSKGGLWKTRISIPPGTYRYKLLIDGKWTVDLYNPHTASDGVDGICSILTVKR